MLSHVVSLLNQLGEQDIIFNETRILEESPAIPVYLYKIILRDRALSCFSSTILIYGFCPDGHGVVCACLDSKSALPGKKEVKDQGTKRCLFSTSCSF